MSKQRKFRLSIRSKFILSICSISFVVLMVAVSYGYYFGIRPQRISLQESRLEMAQMLARYIERITSEEIEKIKLQTSTTSWTTAILESNAKYASMKPEEIQAYFEEMDTQWKQTAANDPLIETYTKNQIGNTLRIFASKDTDIVEFFITDLKGGLVASSGKTTDFYQADESWWLATYNGGHGNIYIGDMEFDESVGITGITIAAPLKDAAGKVIGVCKAVINTDIMFNHLKKFVLEKTGHAILIDKSGKLIFHEGLTPMKEPAFENAIVEKLQNIERGYFIARNSYHHRGQELVAVAKVQAPLLLEHGIHWWVGIEQDSNESFSFLNRLVIQGAVMIPILLAFLIGLGMAFSRVLIAPIEKLQQATKRIGDGDLNYHVDINTRDEIEALADSFNQMSSLLKQTTVSKERFDSIINNMGDSLIVVNIDQTISLVNKAANILLGYEEGELLGQPIKIIFDVTQLVIFQKESKKITKGEQAFGHWEAFLRKKNGSSIDVFFSCSVALEKNTYSNATQDIICLVKDITELKQSERVLEGTNKELMESELTLKNLLQETKKTYDDLIKSHEELKNTQSQLIQAEKLASIGELAAGIAHEVKNPLATMLVGIDYLKKHGSSNEEDKSILNDITEALKRADRVIRGLLDFSVEQKFQMKNEDINIVIEESLLLVKHPIDRSHIVLMKDLKDNLPLVQIDRNKIQQVFVNLIINALYAMPEKGTLTIRTYSKQLEKTGLYVGIA